jgi:hypothetical protein
MSAVKWKAPPRGRRVEELEAVNSPAVAGNSQVVAERGLRRVLRVLVVVRGPAERGLRRVLRVLVVVRGPAERGLRRVLQAWVVVREPAAAWELAVGLGQVAREVVALALRVERASRPVPRVWVVQGVQVPPTCQVWVARWAVITAAVCQHQA